LIALSELHIGRSYWVITRHTAPKEYTSLHEYSLYSIAKNLLQEISNVIVINGDIEDDLNLKNDYRFEQIEEDVRLECTRFGLIKSMNISRPEKDLYKTKSKSNNEKSSDKRTTEFNNTYMIENPIKRNFFDDSIITLSGTLGNIKKYMIDSSLKTTLSSSKLNQTHISNKVPYLRHFFESWKVYVEFYRPTAARLAMHNFSNRTFEEKSISINYYSSKHYLCTSRRTR